MIPIIERYINTNYKNSNNSKNSQNSFNNKLNSLNELTKMISNIKNCDSLFNSEILDSAAFEYCHFIKDPTSKYLFAEEDELLKIRLSHYTDNIEKIKYFKELVLTTSNFNSINNFDELIINLIVYEYENSDKEIRNKTSKNNLHSISILNECFKFYGLNYRKIKNNKYVFVIILIDRNFINRNSNETIQNRNTFNDTKNSDYMKYCLLKCLNDLRVYPRAFIKFLFPENSIKSKYNPYSTNNVQNESDNDLIEFLVRSKSYSSLIEENELSDVSQKIYMNELRKENFENVLEKKNSLVNLISSKRIEKNLLKYKDNDKQLNDLVSDLSNKYLGLRNLYLISYHKIIQVPERALLDIIKIKENRDIILNNNIKYIGVYSYNNAKIDSTIFVFSDNLIKKKKLIEINNNHILSNFNRFKNRKILDMYDIQLIKNDFLNLDVNSIGKIYPQYILNLLNNNISDKYANFIYYNALNLFIMEYPREANMGINMDKFVGIIKSYYEKIEFDENDYIKLFGILKLNKNNSNITTKSPFEKLKNPLEVSEFKNLLNDLGYAYNEIEAIEIFKSICFPDLNLNLKNFIDILKLNSNFKLNSKSNVPIKDNSNNLNEGLALTFNNSINKEEKIIKNIEKKNSSEFKEKNKFDINNGTHKKMNDAANEFNESFIYKKSVSLR